MRTPFHHTVSIIVLVAASVFAFTISPALASHGATLPKGIGAQVSVSTSVGLAPDNYLGLALEMSALCAFRHTDTVFHAKFEQLFMNLGQPILKIAGKGGDYASWKPDAKQSCSTKKSVVDKSEVKAVADFAQRTGTQLLWGLPLINYNPTAAATEAKGVSSILGTSLVGWVPGNEPDEYIGAGMRPKTWTPPQFLAQWEATRSAVASAVPGINFVGPESCCNNTYFEDFAKVATGLVSSVAYHQYAGSRTGETAAYLMAASTLAKLTTRALYYYKFDANNVNVPLWISELNSFASGGANKVSNAYVSALWIADALFQLELDHVSQVDIQDVGGTAYYDPISYLGTPNPLYYGMLLYHTAVPAGSEMVNTKTVLAKKINVTGYAIETPTGGLNLILFNKGTAKTTVQFNADKIYTSAATYRMSAHALTSVTGITIGGHGVAADGTFAAPKTTALALKKTTATSKVASVSTASLSLPADSSTVVSLTP